MRTLPESASRAVPFNPGATTQPLNIAVNGDTDFEPTETFTLTLSGAMGLTRDAEGSLVEIGVRPAVGTITALDLHGDPWTEPGCRGLEDLPESHRSGV